MTVYFFDAQIETDYFDFFCFIDQSLNAILALFRVAENARVLLEEGLHYINFELLDVLSEADEGLHGHLDGSRGNLTWQVEQGNLWPQIGDHQVTDLLTKELELLQLTVRLPKLSYLLWDLLRAVLHRNGHVPAFREEFDEIGGREHDQVEVNEVEDVLLDLAGAQQVEVVPAPALDLVDNLRWVDPGSLNEFGCKQDALGSQ